MARTIIKKLDLRIEKKGLEKLLQELRKINSSDGMSDFLNKFMTAEEKKLILRRLAIIEMINQVKKYREIKKILEVSNDTISNARDIIAGRGYGRNPDRKKKYSALVKQRKIKTYSRKYKGADSITRLLDLI